MHDHVRSQPQMLGVGFHPLTHVVQAAVLTVADCDHEVLADEDHHLAGFDDLARQRHRFVLDVIHGFEHKEQRVVVAIQLGPLVGVHSVFDRQRVQSENVRHFLHLGLVGFVQTDPDERARPRLFRSVLRGSFYFADLGQRGGMRVIAG